MKKILSPRIAIYYDWLNQWGGAERLLLDLLSIFPKAQLYTSVHNPSATKWLPKNVPITASFLNKIPLFKKNSIISALFQPIAIEQFRFDQFDIVISLTSMHGQCLLTSPQTLHICYCLTPNRYLYQKNYSFPVKHLITFYQKIDYCYAQRPDSYLAISKTVRRRIQKNYHRHAQIINPGVDISIFKPALNPTNDYFLTVSRLVPHKNVDLAILSCLQTKNRLKIVNTGPELSYLKKIANGSPLIEFVGTVTQPQLIKLYQNCQALICPQREDFGLSALESLACGRPVLAFKEGGIGEIVIDNKTGLLFSEQSVTSLTQVLKIFPKNKFPPEQCRQRAIHFSKNKFMLSFKRIVLNVWKKYQLPTTTS